MDGPRRTDRALVALLGTAAAGTAGIVVFILVLLIAESRPAIHALGLGSFLTDTAWLPDDTHPDAGRYGLVPMVAATATTTIGAVAVAGPTGIGVALLARTYAPRRLARPLLQIVELMAGIPSVVYGFWGMVALIPWIRRIQPPGASLLAGILVLALMIVPTVALLSDAALRSVPEGPRQAAHALGLSRWGVLRAAVLPAARQGLGLAVLLGTLRALGETMAVLMVCGNVPRLPSSLFDPVRTLTANIALELGYATQAHRAVLFVSGLGLMLAVLALVGLQNALLRPRSHG